MTQPESQSSKRRKIAGWTLFVFGWIVLITENVQLFAREKLENWGVVWLLVVVDLAVYLAVVYVSINWIVKGLNMTKELDVS